MLHLIDNKLYLKKQKDQIPIDLNYFNIKKKDFLFDEFVHTINGNREYFIHKNQLIYDEEIPYKIDKDIMKINSKTKCFLSSVGEYKFSFDYLFYRSAIYCKKIKKPKDKKEIKNMYDLQRFDRFIYENEYFTVLKCNYFSIGYISKPNYKLEKFETAAIKEIYRAFDPILCYDVETCIFFNESLSKTKQHQPYMLAWEYHLNNNILEYEPSRGVIHHQDLNSYSSIGEKFVKLIEDILYDNNLNEIIVFGYNNFNFDDNFILEAFLANRYYIDKRERNGKISTLRIMKNDKVITFKDIIPWLPDVTLKQACIDYNTFDLKGECNVLIYNKMCETKNRIIYFCSEEEFWPIASVTSMMKKLMLKKNERYYMAEEKIFMVYNYITDYCINDVKATIGLFFHLNNSFNRVQRYFYDNELVQLHHSNILRYISPAYVVSKIYKQIFDHKQLKRLKIFNFELARFYSAAYYGGLVNFGALGEYVGESIKCFDVSAMYPTVMTNDYPILQDEEDLEIGIAINISEFQKIIDNTVIKRNEAFKNRTLFDYQWLNEINDIRAIFLVDIFAPTNENEMICISPFPYRYYGSHKISYDYQNKYDVTICTSEMKTLILFGFNIKIKFHIYNTVFLKKDTFFNSIMDPLNKFKMIAKDNGNTADKKLNKLFQNVIYGKLGQHIEHTITTYKYTNYAKNYAKNDEQNVFNSLHYIACFITAEARFVLCRTIYQLQSDSLYRCESLSKRCGMFLLCDTDSVMFDASITTKIDFIINDEMGYWSKEKQDYVVHWKEKKYNGIKKLFILGRKAYVPVNAKNEVISRTLKGIRRDQMALISYDVLKQVCSNIPYTMRYTTLSKKNNLNDDVYDIAKTLLEEEVKKTLTMSDPPNRLVCDNEIVNKNNNDNLLNTLFKDDIKNFLVFVKA